MVILRDSGKIVVIMQELAEILEEYEHSCKNWQKSCKNMNILARIGQNLPESCKIAIRFWPGYIIFSLIPDVF